MSLSQFSHPFEVVSHPQLEPEVKHAILASWASDANAVSNAPTMRQPPGVATKLKLTDIMSALCQLDDGERMHHA